jgi:hypothetical protein
MSMTEAGVIFEHAHWPGVFICEKRNRPAFETKEAMYAFIEKYCPSTRLIHKGKCAACGFWHFVGKGRGPSGASSGTERSS